MTDIVVVDGGEIERKIREIRRTINEMRRMLDVCEGFVNYIEQTLLGGDKNQI